MPLTVQSHNRNIKEKGRCPVLSENKRRRSSSPDFMGRIRQSARHIETEAKEGARRVQHEAQERVRNMTPQQKNGWRKAGRIIGTLLLVFVVTLTIFSGIFMAYINSTMRGKVEVYLDEFETKVSTELYSQDPDTGEWVMYQTLYLNSENRIWTDLEDIPKYLQEAAIAIEDKRFEKHHGVDWKGTTRAIVYTLFGKNVQGGSTITQQLVKNVTGDNEVTVKRKITEIYRALELEKRYEKDEILEAYLNEVFFGQSCYGVVTASRMYFNKDVSDLTLAECASLMGITNNPSMYDPTLSSWTRENNRERQLTILGAMLEQGKISQEEYDEAKAEDIVFSNGFTISGKYVGSDGTATDPEPEEPSTDDAESPEDEEEPAIKGRYSWFTEAMIGDVADALVEKYGITDKVRDNGTTYTMVKAWNGTEEATYKYEGTKTISKGQIFEYSADGEGTVDITTYTGTTTQVKTYDAGSGEITFSATSITNLTNGNSKIDSKDTVVLYVDSEKGTGEKSGEIQLAPHFNGDSANNDNNVTVYVEEGENDNITVIVVDVQNNMNWDR